MSPSLVWDKIARLKVRDFRPHILQRQSISKTPAPAELLFFYVMPELT